MTSLARLFLRDLRYHWKGFTSLTAAACLICAVLTGAFLIGDSVRGTLMDHVSANSAVARYRQRFPIALSTGIVLISCIRTEIISPSFKFSFFVSARLPRASRPVISLSGSAYTSTGMPSFVKPFT